MESQHPAAADTHQAPTRKSWPDKMTSTVSSRPGLALAVIVVLAIVIVVLVMRERGWIGGGQRKSGRAAKKQAAPDLEAENTGDPEIDDLIDSINSSS